MLVEFLRQNLSRTVDIGDRGMWRTLPALSRWGLASRLVSKQPTTYDHHPPQPLQKPFRSFEIVAGLLCVAAGIWMLLQFGLWLGGTVPNLEIRSMRDAALLLVQSIYLLGFGGNLLRSGYVALPSINKVGPIQHNKVGIKWGNGGTALFDLKSMICVSSD
jgi:hypothetical protein